MKTNRAWLQSFGVVAVLGAVLSCAESVSPPRAPHESPAVHVGGAGTSPSLLGVSFLSCTPITADSVTQAVDSMGGSISVGPHVITIPAGALDTAVSITAIAPSDTINRLRLYPEGLQFSRKVSLAMSYANCDAISSLVPKRVAYVDGEFSVLDLLASIDAWWDQVVTGKTDHFSDYVVAW